MTTIAFDGATMACDAAFNGERMLDHLINDSKVRIGCDFLLGIAGDFARFKAWERDTTRENGPVSAWDFNMLNEHIFHETLDAEKIDIIVATEHGVYEFHGPGILLPTSHQPYAIGTGYAYALGAMFQGSTALEAVRTAANFDKDTNETVAVHIAPWLCESAKKATIHENTVGKPAFLLI